jgi:hypothetical protein
MEALQMLKFSLKAKTLDFTGDFITDKDDLAEVDHSDSSKLLLDLFALGHTHAECEDVMDDILTVIAPDVNEELE